jgi:hypothetical protein
MPPIDSGSREAPTTATEAGVSTERSASTAAARSWSSALWRKCSDGTARKLVSTAP